jgi:hypothetical protein
VLNVLRKELVYTYIYIYIYILIVLWIKEFSDVKFANYIVNIIRVGLIYIFIQLSISNAALECQ